MLGKKIAMDRHPIKTLEISWSILLILSWMKSQIRIKVAPLQIFKKDRIYVLEYKLAVIFDRC